MNGMDSAQALVLAKYPDFYHIECPTYTCLLEFDISNLRTLKKLDLITLSYLERQLSEEHDLKRIFGEDKKLTFTFTHNNVVVEKIGIRVGSLMKDNKINCAVQAEADQHGYCSIQ